MTQEKDTAPKNTAIELLSRSLQELNSQRLPEDAQEVADRITKSRAKKGEKEIKARTVQEYLRGNVMNFDTGKEVFTTMKAIVLEREKEVNKLVA